MKLNLAPQLKILCVVVSSEEDVVVVEKNKWREEDTKNKKNKKSDLCLDCVTVCGLLCLSESD